VANAVAEAARRAAEAARQAAEAALQAAERAAQQAAERARQAADRFERRLEAAESRFQAPTTTAAAPGSTPTYSPQEAMALARDRWWEDPQPPPGTGQVPVNVRPQDSAAVLADNWRREAKAEIGMGDPAVFDDYWSANAPAVQGLAEAVSGDSTTAVPDMLLSGDLSQFTNDLVTPALGYLSARNPEASFRLLAVEPQSLPPSGLPQPLSPLVIEVTNGGTVQQFVINPDSSPDGAQYRTSHALQSDPALLQQWSEAARPLLEQAGIDVYAPDDPARVLDQAVFGGYGGGFDETIAAIRALPPGSQAEFAQAFAGTFLRPLSDPVPPEAVLVSVSADPLAAGDGAASLESRVNLDAVDGLGTSTALPPIGGLTQQDWRATLDRLSLNPPATMADLRTELENAGVTAAELQALQASDGNALPALLNLVQDHPNVAFNDQLNLSLLPGGRGAPPTFGSVRYDAQSQVVVVETSLNRFLPTAAEQDLAETYGVADVPMTLRIPLTDALAADPSLDWTRLDGETSPTTAQLQALNGRLRDVDQASVFLHGYQSDRGVWTHDMQDFMDMSGPDTLGIALAGMGSEGGFLGSGASPLTPRQYAFHTMSALDALGLYGKDLTILGHSMGGAAAMEMGLATERMVAQGLSERPEVSYVLLEPAPSGDSVPFLTSYGLGGSWILGESNWIKIQNATGIGVDFLERDIVRDLMPGAPDYIQRVHTSFTDEAGFAQLGATAGGLVHQSEPDPQQLDALFTHNRVLVIGGTQDRIVSTEVLKQIFGEGRVFEVPGNHYAHLPSTIPEQNAAQSQVWPRIRGFLGFYPIPARGPR
jgi:hypothetical protein